MSEAEPWREEIARIIDPMLELGGVTSRAAFAKADAIILAATAHLSAEREAERNKRLDAEQEFADHTEAVSKFLSDLYCIMIDPCAEGPINVQKCCGELLAAATLQREQLAEREELREALREVLATRDAVDKASRRYDEMLEAQGVYSAAEISAALDAFHDALCDVESPDLHARKLVGGQ